MGVSNCNRSGARRSVYCINLMYVSSNVSGIFAEIVIEFIPIAGGPCGFPTDMHISRVPWLSVNLYKALSKQAT
jgi:hypothetical protein